MDKTYTIIHLGPKNSNVFLIKGIIEINFEVKTPLAAKDFLLFSVV